MRKTKHIPVSVHFIEVKVVKPEDSFDKDSPRKLFLKNFSKMLYYTSAQPMVLKQTKIRLKNSGEQMLWLDRCAVSADGRTFRIKLLSASEKHMLEFPENGNPTYLFIRVPEKTGRLLCVHGGEFVSGQDRKTDEIALTYLNARFLFWEKRFQSRFHYELKYASLPDEGFLSGLNKLDGIDSFTLTVERKNMKDPFVQIPEEETSLAETVEISFAKAAKIKSIDPAVVIACGEKMRGDARIRQIYISGRSGNGIRLGRPEAVHGGQSIRVAFSPRTGMLSDDDFFRRADLLLTKLSPAEWNTSPDRTPISDGTDGENSKEGKI